MRGSLQSAALQLSGKSFPLASSSEVRGVLMEEPPLLSIFVEDARRRLESSDSKEELSKEAVFCEVQRLLSDEEVSFS